MAEYIKREALIDRLLSHAFTDDLYGMGLMRGLEIAVAEAKRMPYADFEPVVHGRWVQVICHVEFEDGFVDRLYECCSRCHEPNGRKTSDYCPNCGARMDGE